LTINFLVEMHFPGTVDVGSRILSMGKSSVMMGHAIFQNEKCHAISDSVLVLIDTKTRKPTAMTPEIIQLVDGLSQRLCV
jgi:acyl-CoA thioester hydrolase